MDNYDTPISRHRNNEPPKPVSNENRALPVMADGGRDKRSMSPSRDNVTSD